jgi:hypothetical protein
MSAILCLANLSFAGVPMTNLEGVGGCAFNPFAYPANPGSSLGDPNSDFGKIVGRPQVGAFYIHLPEVHADWTSFGVAETFAKRIEVSYAHETVAMQGRTNLQKDSFGTKLLLVEENSDGEKWIPAVAAGITGKHTSELEQFGFQDVDSTGYDYYLVATKFITDLPLPVLISGGLRSTDSRATGVLGYDDDRDTVFFGNFNVIPIKDVGLGIEYVQGAQYSDFRNADYFDVHACWMVNTHLTLIAAYVNSGDTGSSKAVGLGDGIVFSAQYAS